MDNQEKKIHELIQLLSSRELNVEFRGTEALVRIGKTAVPDLIEAFIEGVKWTRWEAAKALDKILDNCKNTEEVQEFEDKLSNYMSKLRKNCKDKGKIKKAEFEISKMKIKAAMRRNELSGVKNIISQGKPKPPKKGPIFNQLGRIRNG